MNDSRALPFLQIIAAPSYPRALTPQPSEPGVIKSRDAGGARCLVECCSYQTGGLTFGFLWGPGPVLIELESSFNTPRPRSNAATACIRLIQNGFVFASKRSLAIKRQHIDPGQLMGCRTPH